MDNSECLEHISIDFNTLNHPEEWTLHYYVKWTLLIVALFDISLHNILL